EGARVALQGFGAVGAAAARRLHRVGANIVALSTVAGAGHDTGGVDIPEWLAARGELGEKCVTVAPGTQRYYRGEGLFVDCAVLVPAGRQGGIDHEVAGGTEANAGGGGGDL